MHLLIHGLCSISLFYLICDMQIFLENQMNFKPNLTSIYLFPYLHEDHLC